VDEGIQVARRVAGEEVLDAGLFLERDREVLASLPLVSRALDDVPEVRDDTGLEEELSVVVEVDAPGVAGALREDLELVAQGLVPPEGSFAALTPVGGGPQFANVRRADHALAAVQPAVLSPRERVGRFMRVGLVVPAVD